MTDILGRIAQELRDLAEMAENLQDVVGRIAPLSALRDSNAVHELQDFDRLEQALAAVADFIEELSRMAPMDWRMNPRPASRVVLLADLALRLVTHRDSAPQSTGVAAGEFEFF